MDTRQIESSSKATQIRLILFIIIVATIPGYCIAAVLLAVAPTGESNERDAGTSLPTITQTLTRTPTLTPTQIQAFTASPTAGNLQATPQQFRTPIRITNTPIPSATFAPTITLSPTLTLTPSVTPSPTLTLTLTNTPIIPTATFTEVPPPTATFTEVPPPTATFTEVPPPTATTDPGTTGGGTTGGDGSTGGGTTGGNTTGG